MPVKNVVDVAGMRRKCDGCGAQTEKDRMHVVTFRDGPHFLCARCVRYVPPPNLPVWEHVKADIEKGVLD